MACAKVRVAARASSRLALHLSAGWHGFPVLSCGNKTALAVNIRHENGPSAGLIRTPNLQHLRRIYEADPGLNFSESGLQSVDHLSAIGACQVSGGSFGNRFSYWCGAGRECDGRAENEGGGP